MYLSEQLKVVGIGTTVDYNDGFTGDSINITTLHHVMFVLIFGAVTGNAVLTVKSGASAGTQTTAETFNYRYGTATIGSASADVYSAWASSSGLTLTAATYGSTVVVVEIDPDTVTAGQPWLTLALSNAASAGILGVCAVCTPRYEGIAQPTAI